LTAYVVVAWRLQLPGPRPENDGARYILLSRAVLSGHYRDFFLTGAPMHAQYPPGFPAFLAVLSGLFGEGWGLFVAGNLACTVAALALLFDVARRMWTPVVALVGIGVASFLPAWLSPSGPGMNVLAEAPYTLLTLGALWVVVVKPRTARWMAAAAALAIASALTRSIGVTLVTALGLLWLGERRWKAVALYSVVVMLTVGMWFTWTIRANSGVAGRSYLADARISRLDPRPTEPGEGLIGTLVERVVENGTVYATRVVPSAFGQPHVEGTIIDNLAGVGLVVLLLGAGALPLWRRWRVAAVYLICYGTLLLAWTWPVSRFLNPILPLLAFTAVAGAATLGARWGRGATMSVASGLALLAPAVHDDLDQAAWIAGMCEVGEPVEYCRSTVHVDYMRALGFVRDSLGGNAPIAASKDAVLAYITGREALPSHRVSDDPPDQLAEHLQDLGVSHALLAWSGAPLEGAFNNAVAQACSDFEVVRRFGDRALLVQVARGAPGDCATIRAFTTDRPPASDRP